MVSKRLKIVLSSKLIVVFLARPTAQTSNKRDVGTGGEVNYLVNVIEVFKGGVYMKRIGKNVIHVFSGLGLEKNSNCGVTLEEGKTYLFAGDPRRATSPVATAMVDINQCSLAKLWSNVPTVKRDFLRGHLAPTIRGRCEQTLVGASPVTCNCSAQETCLQNTFQNQCCGPCQAWCVPNTYVL